MTLVLSDSWVGHRTKNKAGRILQGRTYHEMPPRVNNPVPNKKERKAMIENVKDVMTKGAGKD